MIMVKNAAINNDNIETTEKVVPWNLEKENMELEDTLFGVKSDFAYKDMITIDGQDIIINDYLRNDADTFEPLL